MLRHMRRAGLIRSRRVLVLIVLLLIVAGLFWWWINDPIDRAYGSFEGQVTGTWDNDGRNMKLENDFSYVDPSGKRWVAATGSVINGASIPQLFWSVTGGPFEGRFRNASVVHDAACIAQAETWQDVHRMFYNAMRCGRVGEGKAQTMFWAVYRFGPRWRPVMESRIENGQEVTVMRIVKEQPPAPQEDIVQKAQRYFDKKQFTAEQIENCTVEQIEAEVAEWDAAGKNP